MQDPNKKVADALNRFKEKMKQKHFGQDKASMVDEVTSKVSSLFVPVIEELAKSSKLNRDELREVISEIKVMAPDIKLPDYPEINIPAPVVNVPKPNVVVNVPEQKQFQLPDILKVMGEMSLSGVNNKNPLPVVLMGLDGKPYAFSQGVSGGGRGDFFTIRDIQNSSGGSVIDADGNLKVAGSFTASAVDNQPVSQVSGNIWSTYVTGIANSSFSELQNGDGRLRVSVETGGSGLTDSELRASAVPVSQVSGAIDSVYVTGVATSIYSEIMNPDGRVKVELPTGSTGLTDTELRASHIDVQQVSGAVDSINIVSQAIGLETRQVSGVIDSVSIVSQIGAIETRQVSGAMDSVFVSGASDSFFAFEVMTTNKTAKSDGADIRAKTDDLGRQVMRHTQVRDLIATAYVSLTTGTETTLKSAVSGAYLDLIYVMGSNTSDSAVTVDIRDGTAGNIITSIVVPAYGTAGVSLPVPIPQSNIGNNWTADMGDFTNTTVYLSALFSQEI